METTPVTRDTWGDIEKRATEGPRGAFSVAIKLLMGLIAFGVIVALIGLPLGLFSETAQVARAEFGPRASLIKYEWFKDASAQLEKKRADILLYEARLTSFATDYGAQRAGWPRDVREQAAQAGSEYLGVVASYNGLAAEYNANSSKFNWSFAEGSAPRTVVQYSAK